MIGQAGLRNDFSIWRVRGVLLKPERKRRRRSKTWLYAGTAAMYPKLGYSDGNIGTTPKNVSVTRSIRREGLFIKRGPLNDYTPR